MKRERGLILEVPFAAEISFREPVTTAAFGSARRRSDSCSGGSVVVMSPFIIRTLCVVLFITIMTGYVLLLKWSLAHYGLLGVAIAGGLCIGVGFLIFNRTEPIG
jgi:hypothetical protein